MTDVTGGRRLRVPVPVRWGDLDAYNHVNNTSMLKLLEEARIQVFWQPDDSGASTLSTAVLDWADQHSVLMLLARQEIEYLAPVPYQRHPLDIHMWFASLGGSSVEICYEVRSPREIASSEDDQIVYARASTTLVKVDAASGKPMRLSTEERAAWAPYVDAPIAFGHRRR